MGKKTKLWEMVWKLRWTASTSEHSQGRRCANSCRNSSSLVEDAVLHFDNRMAGDMYTCLQKRTRRVEANLRLQKS